MAMRVLVVDDEPAIRELLALAFEQKGIATRTVESAEDAVEELGAGDHYDAALVDKNLPGMSGLDLVRHIRAKDPVMAVVMMTGYSSAETAEEALNLDVDAYLEKPFRQLSDAVDRVLEAIRKRTALRAEPAPGPVRLVVAGSADVRQWVKSVVELGTVVAATGGEEELLHALREPADVLVIEGSLFRNRVPEIVERALGRAPGTEVVVLSESQMSLGDLQRLIDLGVRRLVQHRNYARPIIQTLSRVKKKTRG